MNTLLEFNGRKIDYKDREYLAEALRSLRALDLEVNMYTYRQGNTLRSEFRNSSRILRMLALGSKETIRRAAERISKEQLVVIPKERYICDTLRNGPHGPNAEFKIEIRNPVGFLYHPAPIDLQLWERTHYEQVRPK